MRRTACSLALLLLIGVLAAPPAFAAFGAIVQLPASSAYSPYGGPATVTFTFDPGDTATIFTLRIRRPGHGVVKERDVLVDPATQASPHDVAFSWGELSATSPTDYVVDVRRQDGGPVITSGTFTLLPKLVSGLSATPSPFYPLIQDGYKDHTTIGFSLAADTTDTVVHVFADDAYGRCCGTEVRTVDLGPLAAGAHGWVWDGAKDDTSAAPKGTYFARVEATDTNAVTMLSKAQPVELTRGQIRKMATRRKDGSAYAHVGPQQPTARGGECLVYRHRDTRTTFILCANAEISISWHWVMKPGERIESVSFAVDGGSYGCHRKLSHTSTNSTIRVHSPPTSTCTVTSASIRYSYLVQA